MASATPGQKGAAPFAMDSNGNAFGANVGRSGLAPYASFSANSKGRLVGEAGSPTRSHFQRDRDRIIHSTAFRRLKHKTQVFVYHEGDHYRTRLTHSIEVAQIARALARALAVDEDLAEALALSHDFGHTPFGHTGEEELQHLMADYGGFDHNAQSLRIVTKLEQRYAQFDGLNLCWETLEGLVKHNGPLTGTRKNETSVPGPILEFNELFDLDLSNHSGLEAQCAAIADDIAYNAHDLDDGLRAGLFDLEEVAEVPMIGDLLAEVKGQYPKLDKSRVIHEIVRRQITRMVEDVITQSVLSLKQLAPQTDRDVREAGRTIVGFSPQMQRREQEIKKFLFAKMYRAPQIMRIRGDAMQIVKDLFEIYFSGVAQLPVEWSRDLIAAQKRDDESKRARLVCDFLAGMTDRYAILEHQRLFDVTPELR